MPQSPLILTAHSGRKLHDVRAMRNGGQKRLRHTAILRAARGASRLSIALVAYYHLDAALKIPQPAIFIAPHRSMFDIPLGIQTFHRLNASPLLVVSRSHLQMLRVPASNSGCARPPPDLPRLGRKIELAKCWNRGVGERPIRRDHARGTRSPRLLPLGQCPKRCRRTCCTYFGSNRGPWFSWCRAVLAETSTHDVRKRETQACRGSGL